MPCTSAFCHPDTLKCKILSIVIASTLKSTHPHSPPFKGRGRGWGLNSAMPFATRRRQETLAKARRQEYSASEKDTDPTPNPSPTREGRTSGTILQGRGELRRLSYKGGENFGDYPTREGRTSETILQGRGAAAYNAMQQG